MQFLRLFFLFFGDLEFLVPPEKDVKGRVEVPPSLLKQQKESLHKLLLQEGLFSVNIKVNEQ